MYPFSCFRPVPLPPYAHTQVVPPFNENAPIDIKSEEDIIKMRQSCRLVRVQCATSNLTGPFPAEFAIFTYRPGKYCFKRVKCCELEWLLTKLTNWFSTWQWLTTLTHPPSIIKDFQNLSAHPSTTWVYLTQSLLLFNRTVRMFLDMLS